MKNNFSAHVTSILSGVGAFIALVHPGFKLPVTVQAIAVTVCTLAAAGIQAYHLFAHRSLQANLIAAEHLANAISAKQPPQA